MDIGIGIDLWIETQQTLDFLDRMIQRMSDMRPAWQALHSVVIGTVKMNFAARGRPSWAPLKTDKKRYTGLLSKADSQVRRGAFDPTLAMWPDRAAWIANVGPAGVAIQNGIDRIVTVPAFTRRVTEVFGRPVRSGVMARVPAHNMHIKMPARPYFCFYTGDDEDENRIKNVVKNYLFTAQANYTGFDSLDYGPNAFWR